MKINLQQVCFKLSSQILIYFTGRWFNIEQLRSTPLVWRKVSHLLNILAWRIPWRQHPVITKIIRTEDKSPRWTIIMTHFHMNKKDFSLYCKHTQDRLWIIYLTFSSNFILYAYVVGIKTLCLARKFIYFWLKQESLGAVFLVSRTGCNYILCSLE